MRDRLLLFWSQMVRWAALLLVASTLAGAADETDDAEPVRGITISTHRGGQDWGSDRMPEALAEIQAIGANWVAIHPYARIRGDGTVSTRHPLDDASPPEHIVRPIREAKAAGVKILIKPHLAYWGSPFSWRGEIGFDSEDDWNRFWTGYEAFIIQVARWTTDADGFVIGTELRLMQDQDARWRGLIEKVRVETGVPLTYAANWDDYDRVTFWDALDVIGVQAYFPLTQTDDRGEAAIQRGWDQWMARLSAYSKEHARPIVFTELGYNQAYDAPVAPWDYETDDEGARAVQELCMRVALRSVENEPSVLGVFLWKWFVPPRRVGRNFQLATPNMQRVIRESWIAP